MLALVLQEAEAKVEADISETVEGKTHEASRGGTGEGQENPQISERREVWVVGKTPTCCAVLRKFWLGQCGILEPRSPVKVHMRPTSSVPLPGLLTGWKQQGRHESCEQCRNGSRGTELGSPVPPAAGGPNSTVPAHRSWSLKPGAGRMIWAGMAQGFWLYWRLPISGPDLWPLQPRASLPALNWDFCCRWLPDRLCLLPHWQPSSYCV